MKSLLLEKKHKHLLEISRQMTPEERITAFFNHSQLMVQMYYSGKKHFTQIASFSKTL